MNNPIKKGTTLQKKLALFFLLLLTSIVVVTLIIVWRTTYNHLTLQLNAQFNTATKVVEDKIYSRVKALEADLQPVSKDFNTKKLISTASKDPASLKVAMDNFQANRWNTDIYWVLDADSNILASSKGAGLISPDVVNTLASDGVRWYQHQQTFYLMKVMPVRFVELSGQINAWIVTGIKTDKLFDDKLVELTNMHVSIYHPASKTMIASTFINNSTHAFDINTEVNKVNVGKESYLYVSSNLGDWLTDPVSLVLARNENSAYLSNQVLRNELIIVLILAAILAWLAAVLVSRGITLPLEKLASIARNISKGKYIDNFPTYSAREVETLSKAINNMQSGIVQREKSINQLAFFDELTGLPNRLQFNQLIESRIQQYPANELVVLTMDVDRFKEINDTVGHEIGDQLLQLITNRLAGYMEYSPVFARLSGDEFGIVFDGANVANIDLIAKNIVALFERPFTIGDLVLDIDFSIGMAVYPTDANTHQELLQCADIAMYSCKGQHYRYAIYKAELNRYSVMRLNLMSELKGALKQGQLELHYQPKLSLKENAINTVECLIRWTHPEYGFVSPDEFIPLAEQTGAIRHVTNWALDKACSELENWRSQGIHLGVAVNISAMDLVDMRLPTYIAELLTKYQLTSDLLTLEVTESAVMSDPDSAFRALNILKTMGITLSIDDFGTGYSSMAQLKKMPVDELKIDKTFVLDLASNKGDQVMVKTLISLANNLSLKTVAEGVEDVETLKLLKQYGCTKAQGFYMSKALPAAQFNIWYQEFNQKITSGS